MSKHNHTVNTQILGETYCIKCPENELDDLQAASAYLNQKMREFSRCIQTNKREKLAIMAALNIAHELLSTKNLKNNHTQTVESRIKLMNDKIQESLQTQTEIDL